MSAKYITLSDHAAASEFAADWIADHIHGKPNLTATFAAGNTPMQAYRLLTEKARAGQLSFHQLRLIGLDEWVGLGLGDKGSCIETLNEQFYRPAEIQSSRIDYFDGRAKNLELEARRISNLIERSGGIDLIVLGVGVNGHIGFNEPGLSLSGNFSLVSLSETTREIGRKYFDGGDTPANGATMTLAAIQKARNILVMATGEKKRGAVQAILRKDPTCPASAFCELPQAVYVFDAESNPQ